MDIIETLEEMKARYTLNSELSNSDKSFIERYYERATQKPFSKTSCNECYKDAFVEMYYLIKKKGLPKMNKFILKRGEIVRVELYNEDKSIYESKVYNRSNITDEISIAYLRKYPKMIDLYEGYPDNYEEVLEEKAPEVLEEKAKPKKKENKKEKVPEVIEEKDIDTKEEEQA